MSLAVGSGIDTKPITKKENTVNDHLTRYVFSPLVDISLSDRNMTGAMSKSQIVARRINNLRDVPYKVRDESSDVLLDTQTEVEDVPLREYVNTAKAQADYLYTAYGDKGVIIIEDLTGLSEQDVIQIEDAIMPDGFETMISLANYLSNKDSSLKENIKKSGIAGENLKKAKKTVESIKVGLSKALEFASQYLAESKAEIINARNGKAGKSSHDPFDIFLYEQTGTPVLKERDVEFAHTKEVAQNSGNLELASAIEKLSQVVAPQTDDKRVKDLEAKIEELTALVQKLAVPSDVPSDK